MQFFLGVLVAALTVATGVFSNVLARMGERQRRLSRRESLTGCFNRRAFYELFPRESERARRLGQGLALVFLDIDHFKSINDRFGHETGDRVLQQLAARLRCIIRETDLLFRWGGEEFVILLAAHGADGGAGARPSASGRRSPGRPVPGERRPDARGGHGERRRRGHVRPGRWTPTRSSGGPTPPATGRRREGGTASRPSPRRATWPPPVREGRSRGA